MSNLWCYERNGHEGGPISAQLLKQLASDGQITPADLIWKEGTDRKVPASHVKGLFTDAMASTESPASVAADDQPPALPQDGWGSEEVFTTAEAVPSAAFHSVSVHRSSPASPSGSPELSPEQRTQAVVSTANPMEGLVTAMVASGAILCVVGTIWFIAAYNLDTTTGPSYEKVHNMGLIEDRRFGSAVASVLVIAGSVLLGCGGVAKTVLSVAKPRAPTHTDNLPGPDDWQDQHVDRTGRKTTPRDGLDAEAAASEALGLGLR